MEWNDKLVLVTGGASFIGSHLVDMLIRLGAKVRVADNLSSGKIDNIREHIDKKTIEFVETDLRELSSTRLVMKNMEFVFHLAASHGGRGYITRHPAECATNLALDGVVFLAASEARVEKVIYASSGCVYPPHLQDDPNQTIFLREDMVGPPYEADSMYGWTKLMGELALRAYYEQHGLRSAICRYFTVYGPRATESHALIAMIARAFVRQDPIGVWGTGQQVRNWTYVSDIINGTCLAAEKIEDATAVNLGTMDGIRVSDAIEQILHYVGHNVPLRYFPEMPTGPYNRVADAGLAFRLLGWTPEVSFPVGLATTVDWYFENKDPSAIQSMIDNNLFER
jgi:nucleoside-diphosphate-sugar epimerase